jgi:import inner membrane translocase subunit TIM44
LHIVVEHQHVAFVSSHQPPPRPLGFFGQLIDNIKQEMTKSKEMKDSLKKFRQDAAELEQSEALKKAR